MTKKYWLETLGCPKNQVDSDKLEGMLRDKGMSSAQDPSLADLIMVNTCAFIEESRKDSLETIKQLSEQKQKKSNLVITGCMAERYGGDMNAMLAEEQIEADLIAGFGVSVDIPTRMSADSEKPIPSFDLLNLPRPASRHPWAYLKAAEGCDKKCGYCAIPSFRGPQRSRSISSILEEADALATESGSGLKTKELVLVAQDLLSYGHDVSAGGAEANADIVELFEKVREKIEWVRLLYLYPSGITAPVIEAVAYSEVPYFDLSLQHASRNMTKKMRRWGEAETFLNLISDIRQKNKNAVFRSNFIVGYPGETEADHQILLDFLQAAKLDWGGFFLYSEEEGTYSKSLPDKVPMGLARERMDEAQQMQLQITEEKRDDLVGEKVKVLVDEAGAARSFREAPEIDGVIHVPNDLQQGRFYDVIITGTAGCDLYAEKA